MAIPVKSLEAIKYSNVGDRAMAHPNTPVMAGPHKKQPRRPTVQMNGALLEK
jgi:hypothetical protein